MDLLVGIENSYTAVLAAELHSPRAAYYVASLDIKLHISVKY